MDYNWTNCSKVVKTEVLTLVAELQRLLEDNLTGIYLYGSMAAGGFNPERSDIDILVVTPHNMSGETKKNLLELLWRMSRVPSALDITFLVSSVLHPFQPALPIEFHYAEKLREFYLQGLRTQGGTAWLDATKEDAHLVLALTALRHYGICLYGTPIAEAIPDVPESLFRATLLDVMRNTLETYLSDPFTCVLNACRCLAYLRTGSYLSKSAAGTWALSALPAEYHPLITQSLAIYRSERLGRALGRKILDDFVAFTQQEIAK
ncbi:aminoglycoside adenylyltransferase domain-containing protein [Dictyobacter arantiisoli]|uniref:Aminoglycoside nucleotidyltransferase ANT9 n=1 Tax=Dictyobacter arantiisoli TaxID=2014874 RepID=A0A5A5TD35_9CHLR|nr:aminoglycoside adenylyltransferase domain-containing protein [Dictyobacter arantiisoli]GCF08939.1 aminoglycoside nucleotidyltransferase ANT9 [Dictyobacter arantiisoli]